MDSKETRRSNQENRDVEMEESEGTSDDRSGEQEATCKALKIQNGISLSEQQPKLNNNTTNSALTSKSSLVISNGAQIQRQDPPNILEQSSSDPTKASANSDNTNFCSRIPASACLQNQSNHEPAMHSNSPGFSNGHSDSSVSVAGISSENICYADSDIRNNVDYVFGIDKCPPKVSCGSSPESDGKWAASGSSYGTESTLNNIGGSIGSTSHGTCCFLRPNINGNRDGEASGGSQIRRETVERRDSSSGNEGDLSDGEDYCIYTYKGNDEASPPTNGRPPINLGMDEDAAIGGQSNSGRSSPEMDFLEMDFDPGPSCEQDTGDSDLASINEDIQNLTMDNVEADQVLLNDLSKVVSRQQIMVPEPAPPKAQEQNVSAEIDQGNNEGTSGSSSHGNTCTSPGMQCMPSTSAGLRKWEVSSLNRSMGCPLRESYSYHNTSGDLISPGDNRDTEAELWADNSSVSVPENFNFNTRKNNLSSTLYHRMMAKKLMLNKQTAFNQSGDSNLESELCSARLDGTSSVEKVMLWSEQEATVKQVTQIGTSACGATSAINALLALDIPFSLEVLVKGVATRLREPGTPLPRYLVSRSWAGATHKDLIRGISLATNGAAITKFFPFYPERNVSLSHWLHHWISRGAAPIATLNLQNCGTGSNIPDAWHHQMIFGVGQSGVYMTNPLECVPEQLVWHQLVSPSILLVRRADVLAHWNPATDLTPLTRFDQHWRKLNVLGQVVNMVRETMGERKQMTNSTSGASHIRIPASFQAGITLVMRSDAPAVEELMHIEQLPLL